ncbi:MAG: Xaa-Pro peptidase family protein [Pseudomonadota bacterium]
MTQKNASKDPGRVYESRLKSLRKLMRQVHLDAFMVLIPENRRYLSGFIGEDTQFDESAGALLITGSTLLLATDSRYETQAAYEAPLYRIFCYKEGLAKAFPEILGILKARRIGFESIRISVRDHGRIVEEIRSKKIPVELVPIEDLVERRRLIKSKAEIDAIRSALNVAESALLSVSGLIRPGVMETQAAWSLEKEMREAGAESLSFPVIVASGPNSALPHAIPGKRCFKSGEPILIDWGARLNGYCSDISRTVFIGKPDPVFKKMFDTVSDAQKKAIDAIRPGVSSRVIDRIARSHIEKKGFKGRFGHGLGHGVGLAIHEGPRINPLKDTPLMPGMVFTVEPGIYIPGLGGVRLENMVVVRKEGAETLNRLGLPYSFAGF